LPGCGRGVYGAGLDAAEAERCERFDERAVLVQPGRQAHRVRKGKPHHLDRVVRQIRPQRARCAHCMGSRQRVQREAVRCFRVQSEEQGTGEPVRRRRLQCLSQQGSALAGREVPPSCAPSVPDAGISTGRKFALYDILVLCSIQLTQVQVRQLQRAALRDLHITL